MTDPLKFVSGTSGKIVPDAFHGTSLAVAERIASGEPFVPSRGEDKYLGDGVYFFEGDFDAALAYPRDRGIEEPGVIQAVVSLNNCLDLTRSKHREMIKEVQTELVAKMGCSVNDAAAISYLCELAEINVARAVHIKRSPHRRGLVKMFSGSRFYDGQSIYLCVKNLGNIYSVKLATG